MDLDPENHIETLSAFVKPLTLNVNADPHLKDGRPVLVLLHGFTQSARSWDFVRDGLRRIGPTVAIDLIGHGDSPKSEDPALYRMDACREQVEAALRRHKISKAWLVGYSMGGRVALQIAANRPSLVAGLVLISTTAGFPEIAPRAARIRSDEALAERIPGWGIHDFVDYWLGLEMFNGYKRLPLSFQRAMRREKMCNSPVALANSLRGMGAGAMPPVWAHLRDMHFPALVMAGELDEKFAALARSMAAALPEGNLSIVPDAGHSIHLEAPQRFLNTVIGYFDRLREG